MQADINTQLGRSHLQQNVKHSSVVIMLTTKIILNWKV